MVYFQFLFYYQTTTESVLKDRRRDRCVCCITYGIL